MAEFNSETDRRAGAEMNALLNVWQKREKDRVIQKIDEDTIDFNTVDSKKYLTDEEIARLSKDIIYRVDFTYKLSAIANRFDPQSSDGQFARARANALKAYIDEVEGRWHYSLPEYLEETLALPQKSPVTFNLIPPYTIEAQRRVVVGLTSKLGFDFNRDRWTDFVATNLLSQEEIVKAYQEAEEKFTPIFKDITGLEEKPDYQLIFREEPRYTWVNWTKGDIDGRTLTINTHPDVRSRWLRGTAGPNIIHELGGHIYEAEVWRRNIENGLINPMYGITTIPGPEQWHLEGFADTLVFFDDRFYNQLDDFERLAVELRLYENFVLRNALIKVNDDPNTTSEIKDSLMSNLPNRPEVYISRHLQQSYQSPSRRSYNAAYGAAYEHWKWAKELTGEKKRWQLWAQKDRRSELVDFFMQQPRLPMQIYNRVQMLDGVRAA